MEPATPRDLCNALARSNLHPPEEVRALLKRFRQEAARSGEDVAAFAGWLVTQGSIATSRPATAGCRSSGHQRERFLGVRHGLQSHRQSVVILPSRVLLPVFPEFIQSGGRAEVVGS